MTRLTVLEPENGTISRLIVHALQRLRTRSSRNPIPKEKGSGRGGILVWSSHPGCEVPAFKAVCRILLLPGSFHVQAPIRADCVVSYGLSERDCLSFSSMSGDRLVLSIRRELPTLAGDLLECQDIPLKTADAKADRLDTLAALSALLLLGVSPGELRI